MRHPFSISLSVSSFFCINSIFPARTTIDGFLNWLDIPKGFLGCISLVSTGGLFFDTCFLFFLGFFLCSPPLAW